MLEVIETLEVEFANSGTVKVWLAPETITVCNALTVASMLAPAVPLMAVMVP